MLLEVGPRIAARDVDLLEIGHVDHRPHADIVLHERDVDRKFVVALDELHRAVQRIDQPVELPVAALVVEHLAPLLAQDGDARRPEVLADGLVGHAVGQRNGRPVVLETYVVILLVLVDVHDGGTCPDRGIEQGRQQIHSHLVVNHRFPLFVEVTAFDRHKDKENLRDCEIFNTQFAASARCSGASAAAPEPTATATLGRRIRQPDSKMARPLRRRDAPVGTLRGRRPCRKRTTPPTKSTPRPHASPPKTVPEAPRRKKFLPGLLFIR